MLKLSGIVLCALLSVSLAHAENVAKKEIVEVTLQQFKVVKRGQAEALEPVERVKPGEMIEYQAVYRNTSSRAVGQLQATLPVPANVEYLPNTAKPSAVQASVDGITYAPVPLRRSVKLPSGQTEMRDVPVVEYRSLRWSIGDLPANQKVTVSARMRLTPLVKTGMEGAKK